VDVTLVPGFNPGPYTGSGNNTYVIAGREPALIDAATGSAPHVNAVEEALGGHPLSRVLVTHGHSDHASGSSALAARWPGAEFMKMPWPERDEQYAVTWRAIHDEDRVIAGDVTLRAVYTPGHAPDHLCFFEEASRTLFSGDLVIQGRTVVIPASFGGSLVSYLDSLETVRALGPSRVLPAHGPEIRNLDALIDEYVAHRNRRESEILAALKSSASSQTPEQLVDEIYTGLPDPLRSAAAESVLSHLVKLRDEGRVRESDPDGCWALLPGR
jgi:glyoxylase-like metal-dependent hydrolase (beta-lactamase superfamily II)